MANFDNVEQVIDALKTGIPPDMFTLNEVQFNIVFPLTLDETIRVDNNVNKGVFVYNANDITKTTAASLPEWLIFSWNKRDDQLSENKVNTIGSIVQVTFLNFTKNTAIDAKVDTGATISSLHVDDYHVDQNTNRITFTSSILSPNKITMPLDDTHIVKSAEGGDPRPVVRLNIEVGGQQMKDVQFNLNDRSQMKYSVLLGSNALQQGKFLINPTLEWSLVNKIPDPEPEINTQEVYEMFAKSNVTMADLIKHMRTHVVENLQNIEYK